MFRIMKNLIATLAFVLAGLVSAEVEITVTVEPQTALPGTDVTITCEAKGAAGSGYIQWYKEIIGGEGSKPHIEQISTNQNIQVPYSKIDRYSGNYDEVGDTKICKIMIKEAQMEDSGTYQCLESSSQKLKENSLTVFGPIQELSFLNHTEGEHLKFIEGQSIPLACVANGSVPAPILSLKVGDRDVTNEFTQEAHTYLQCGESQGSGKTCLAHTTHSFEAKTTTFTPKAEDDGKMLVCTGSIVEAGEQLPSKFASLQIEVEYPPKVECQHTINLETHKRNARIDCKVWSKPAHSQDDLSWSWTVGDNRIEIVPGETYEDVTAEYSQSTHTASLVFKQLFEKHFEHTYALNVSNVHGVTTHAVRLEIQASTPKSGESIGDAGTASWSAFLMSIVFVYAAVIIIK